MRLGLPSGAARTTLAVRDERPPTGDDDPGTSLRTGFSPSDMKLSELWIACMGLGGSFSKESARSITIYSMVGSASGAGGQMAETGVSVWQTQRPIILAHLSEWIDGLVAAGVREEVISIEVHPQADPGPRALWNWWLGFVIENHDIEAVVEPGLSALLFENEDSRFEDDVPLNRVVDYLIQRTQL